MQNQPQSTCKFALAVAAVLPLGCPAWAAAPASITIQADKPGARIGPLFYSLMTEEINHSYDGEQESLTDLARRYKQDIMLVEYIAPHIREINDIVHGLPGGKGRGTFFWEPAKGGPGGPGVFERSGATKPEIESYTELVTQHQK